MTQKPRISVGIIGAGNIAGHHIPGYLQAAEHAQITAIADVDLERARKHTERLGEVEVFEDYREMIASADLDAVDICLPHHLHQDAIVAAAGAGKHILCEKPLCLTLDEADVVRRAVRAAGVTLMCAHNQLYLPTVVRAREIVRQGDLGNVFAARATDVFELDVNAHTLGWRAIRATSGGGELIDTGYHPSYMLLHLVDSVPLKVAAMLSRHRLTFMEGEDTAHVLVEFESGTIGSIVTGWAYEPPGFTERFSVTGEKGSLWSDGRQLLFKARKGEPVVVQDAGASAPDTYVLEVVDFIACLRENRRPLNTEVEGLNVLKLILAAYASAERGEIVELKNF